MPSPQVVRLSSTTKKLTTKSKLFERKANGEWKHPANNPLFYLSMFFSPFLSTSVKKERECLRGTTRPKNPQNSNCLAKQSERWSRPKQELESQHGLWE